MKILSVLKELVSLVKTNLRSTCNIILGEEKRKKRIARYFCLFWLLPQQNFH